MIFGLFSKIKIIMVGALAALLPILYIIGRKDGAKIEEVKQVKASAKAAEQRADFYKEMETTNNEIESTKPRDRDDVVERLREHGL
jgi:hypothetical protein|tara:strand:- start:813 stop:1070 length:258 start_codon:yes stop_codon:yes gene_type:complete